MSSSPRTFDVVWFPGQMHCGECQGALRHEPIYEMGKLAGFKRGEAVVMACGNSRCSRYEKRLAFPLTTYECVQLEDAPQ